MGVSIRACSGCVQQPQVVGLSLRQASGIQEDVRMLVFWIGIATAVIACLAVFFVLAARAPIMDEDPDLPEPAERIADRQARLKSRKQRAA